MRDTSAVAGISGISSIICSFLNLRTGMKGRPKEERQSMISIPQHRLIIRRAIWITRLPFRHGTALHQSILSSSILSLRARTPSEPQEQKSLDSSHSHVWASSPTTVRSSPEVNNCSPIANSGLLGFELRNYRRYLWMSWREGMRGPLRMDWGW